MRRLTLAVAAVLVALACGPVLAGDGEARVYGPDGRYMGRATEDRANPQQRSLYDAKGQYQGRVMTLPDGSTRVYDQHGRYLGRATSGGRQPEAK